MKPPRSSLLACSGCRGSLLRALTPRNTVSPLPRISSLRSYTRPSIAPKPNLDIKHIRQNPGLYEQNCIDRNYPAQAKHSWRIAELHQQWLGCQQSARSLRERSNLIRRRLANFGSLAAADDDDPRLTESLRAASKDELLAEAKTLKNRLATIEADESRLQAEIESLALELPNLTSPYTPVGREPAVLGYINDHPEPPGSTSDRVWRSHVHVGAELGILDFQAAAATSGWGWYHLVDDGALLEQALVQYALAVARKHGFRPVAPPSIVYGHVAAACGFMPRDQNGEQQVYSLERGAERDRDPADQGGKPGLVLAGTAEIPLAGMKAGLVMDEAELPLKLVGVSRCYRAEAGARGVDTKGLYRVHEFTKVELFAWTLPDRGGEETGDEQFVADPEAGSTTPTMSARVFDEMAAVQREILEGLGLHCRVLEMPTADLGASASRKWDVEAFFPSRRATKAEGWGELTSLSDCTDFQSRRLNTRVRVGPRGALDYPHTLNGTALAVPRVLAAVLENGWDERAKVVRVPEVLRGWMDGRDVMSRRK